MTLRRLMLVDDEPHVLQSLQRLLHRHFSEQGYRIDLFADPSKALERINDATFAVVISDFRMPGMDGIALLKAIKVVQPDAMRLILSATADRRVLIEAINEAEILRFIAKPWDDDEVVKAVQQALSRHDQLQDDRRLADELRVRQGVMTPQEQELRRLEEEEPGITKVNWGPEGSVILGDPE
jgi:two-component system, probable response regulator PhcQ